MIELCALPTWWFWRGGCTRSHSEHGRETPQRRWYFDLSHGRVGRCQVCKTQNQSLLHDPATGKQTGRLQSGPFVVARMNGRMQPRTRAHPEILRSAKTGSGALQAMTSPSSVRVHRYFGQPENIRGVEQQPVARQAHNLKAAGSNPAPATKSKQSNTSSKSSHQGAFWRSGLSPALCSAGTDHREIVVATDLAAFERYFQAVGRAAVGDAER